MVRALEGVVRVVRVRGFKVVGKDPAAGKGAYFEPISGRKYYLDPGKGGYKNSMRELPHVDVHRMFEGNVIEAVKRKYPLGDRLYVQE